VSNNTVSRSVIIEVGYYCTHGDGEDHSSTTVNVVFLPFSMCAVIWVGF